MDDKAGTKEIFRFCNYSKISLKNEAGRIGHTRYYFQKLKMRDYNDMIYGRNFLDQPVKKDIRASENIRKVTPGQKDYYVTSCLRDYSYSLKELSVDCDRFK